ncbi:MAG: transcriptional regulator PpsR [Pseudomonadota bacterium]
MTSRGTRYWTNGAIPLVAPDILGDIIATASDLAIVMQEEGEVLSVIPNPHQTGFRDIEAWVGQNFRDVLTIESVPKFNARMAALGSGESDLRPIELNHTGKGPWDLPIRYTFHRIGPDGTIIMLGRDLRPVAEMQRQLVKAQLALERDYEAQREIGTRFRVLMESAREAFVFVGAGSGRVNEINAAAAKLLGASQSDLMGASFVQEFEGRRRGEFLDALASTAAAEVQRAITLRARRTGADLSLIPTLFRAAGERFLLCRLAPENEVPRASGQLEARLLHYYEQGVDGIVFTDQDGIVLSANEAFLDMVEMAQAAGLKGRSMADFLARGAVDLKLLIDNAARQGRIRTYATQLNGAFGAQHSVEVSATVANDQAHGGFAFILREAPRPDAGLKPGLPVSDDAMRSVRELVGSAALKDIVSETTDVIEKMCIETAIELTGNNRVATAEMLGLSRQSLYVKLRKYGILARDDAE